MGLWEFVSSRALTPFEYRLHGPYSFSAAEEAAAERFTKRACAALGYGLEAYAMPHTLGLCVHIRSAGLSQAFYDDEALNLGAWPKALVWACVALGGVNSAEEAEIRLDMLAEPKAASGLRFRECGNDA